MAKEISFSTFTLKPYRNDMKMESTYRSSEIQNVLKGTQMSSKVPNTNADSVIAHSMNKKSELNGGPCKWMIEFI